jgi:serine/threonine-protein kinase RsbW
MGADDVGRALDLDLPAVPASSTHAREVVRDALARVAVDMAAVDLAVTEAVTNVIIHAYRDRGPGDDPGRVRIGLVIEADAALVVVADEGIGMVSRTDSPGLGMGLSIIASVCDTLQIEQRHDGTRIHMGFVVDAERCRAEGEGIARRG